MPDNFFWKNIRWYKCPEKQKIEEVLFQSEEILFNIKKYFGMIFSM